MRQAHKCNRCGYEWFSNKEPKTCAGCGSPYWNKERVKDIPEDRKAKTVK